MMWLPALLAAFLAQTAAGGRAAEVRFDSSRAYEHMRQLVSQGPRPAGSAAIEQSRTYIKAQLAAAGLKAVDQAFDASTPAGVVHMVNLSVTIPGARKDRRTHARGWPASSPRQVALSEVVIRLLNPVVATRTEDVENLRVGQVDE